MMNNTVHHEAVTAVTLAAVPLDLKLRPGEQVLSTTRLRLLTCGGKRHLCEHKTPMPIYRAACIDGERSGRGACFHQCLEQILYQLVKSSLQSLGYYICLIGTSWSSN